MKNLSKSDQLVLVGIGVLFIFFLYYQFIINPALTKIGDLNLQIANKKQTVDAIQNMEVINNKLQKNITTLKTKYEIAKKSLPSELRDPEIENDLNKLAEDSKVTVQSMNFGTAAEYTQSTVATSNATKAAPVQTGKLMNVSVTLSLKGQYVDIINYIKSLEKASRISEVENININKDGTGKGINVSIVVNYYYISNNSSDSSVVYNITPPVVPNNNLFN